MNLLDVIPAGWCTVSEAGAIVDVNPAAAKLLGLAREDLRGQPLSRFMFEDDLRKGAAFFEKVRSRIGSEQVELRLLRDGSPFWASVLATAVRSEEASPTLHVVIIDITAYRQSEDALSEGLRRIRAQQEAISAASQSDAFITGDVDQLAREITQLAAKTVGVERASVWLFNDGETELRGISLYEATPERHSAGGVLTEAQCGPQFAALKTARFVAVDDAATDPRTAHVVESLKPRRVTSTLAALVQVSSHRLGVLCLEHVDRPHRWKSDEIDFACRLADQIALSLINRARREAQQTLRASEARYRRQFESARDGILLLDAFTAEVADVNPWLAALVGMPREEMLGRRVWELPSFRDLVPNQDRFRELVENESFRSEDMAVVAANGRRIAVVFVSTVYLVNDREVIQCNIRDISARKQGDEQLRKFSRIVEQAPLSVAITDLAGELEYVNPMFCKVTGYEREEVLGKNPRLLQSGGTPPEIHVEMWRTITAGHVWQGEFQNRRKNGDLYIEQALIAPVVGPDGKATHYVALKEDITERREAENALTETLRVNQALLREVHHRVKNNLQVITSLLRLEGARTAEEGTRVVLKEMQGRILSMALLHETLYRSGNFGRVELASYLQQLSQQLFRGQGPGSGTAELTLDLSPVQVQIDQAIPCGLMVNEMLTNALKHGFAEGRNGEVRVTLRPEGDDFVHLEVRDNGVGLPADFEARRGRSLGLQLISDLARQLGGRVEVGPGPGASFAVAFPRVKPQSTGPTLRPHGEEPRR